MNTLTPTFGVEHTPPNNLLFAAAPPFGRFGVVTSRLCSVFVKFRRTAICSIFWPLVKGLPAFTGGGILSTRHKTTYNITTDL